MDRRGDFRARGAQRTGVPRPLGSPQSNRALALGLDHRASGIVGIVNVRGLGAVLGIVGLCRRHDRSRRSALVLAPQGVEGSIELLARVSINHGRVFL